MNEEIALTVIAAMSVVWVAMAAFTLRQVRRTFREASEFLAVVRAELVPFLQQARELEGSVQHASGFFRAVGDWGKTLKESENKFREKSNGWVAEVMAMGAGLRAISGLFRRTVYHRERSLSDDRS